jgi:hypothetical protein
MTSSPTKLARIVDDLWAGGHAGVVETDSTLTVHALDVESVKKIQGAVGPLGWTAQIVDDADEVVAFESLEPDFGPFRIEIRKPIQEGILRVISLEGFRQLLTSTRDDPVWQIACAKVGFASEASTFQPWGQSEIFSPSPPTKSPRSFIRDSAEQRRAPRDVRTWLPRSEVSSQLWEEPIFQTFAQVAVPKLIFCTASEISSEDVIFVGPPKVKLATPSGDVARELGLQGFNELRLAVAWIYENSQTTEQRHGLFGAELARSVGPSETIGSLMKRCACTALDGARLAFQLSLSEIGREAIKAQGDLRKALADDTAKLVENARSVATAAGLAISTAIGLFAARAVSQTPGWVLSGISAVVSLYLIAVIGSGISYLRLQEDIRREWRKRLYQFIPEDDYQAMVEKPSKRSGTIFYIAALIGGAVAIGAFIVAFLLWKIHNPESQGLPQSIRS